jgi:hypothetical protein
MKEHRWSLDRVGKHQCWVRIYSSGLKQRVVLPVSPSDCKVWKNKLAELRRLNVSRDRFHADAADAAAAA